jgi:hypothetical protein
MGEGLGWTGIVIFTRRPLLLDFGFVWLRLAEERLTFAGGFFFIELHLPQLPPSDAFGQPVENSCAMRARYIREKAVRVNPLGFRRTLG